LMQDQVESLLRGKRLVFLVGAPRSGTTWLQLLLSRSPQVVSAQETHLFNLYLRPMVGEWNRIRQSGERIGLNQTLSEEEFRQLIRGASGYALARIAQNKPSADVILEKTPNHVQCWREILDVWPDAHFIHIIRDPRSVVSSLLVASRSWASQWASPKVTVNCERWISDVTSGRQIRSATPNYQEVAFQELLTNVPDVLMGLLAGIGAASSRAECERYAEECNIENLKAGNLKNAPFDVGKMHKESFRIGSSESWRDELSTWEIALIERLAGPLMLELGFKPVSRSKMTLAFLDLDRMAANSARAAKRRIKALILR